MARLNVRFPAMAALADNTHAGVAALMIAQPAGMPTAVDPPQDARISPRELHEARRFHTTRVRFRLAAVDKAGS